MMSHDHSIYLGYLGLTVIGGDVLTASTHVGLHCLRGSIMVHQGVGKKHLGTSQLYDQPNLAPEHEQNMNQAAI